MGCIVETNAVFSADSVIPVFAGPIPSQIYSLISRVAAEQHITATAAIKRDLQLAFSAFVSDPLMTIPIGEARELFDRMIARTKKYLAMYKV